MGGPRVRPVLPRRRPGARGRRRRDDGQGPRRGGAQRDRAPLRPAGRIVVGPPRRLLLPRRARRTGGAHRHGRRRGARRVLVALGRRAGVPLPPARPRGGLPGGAHRGLGRDRLVPRGRAVPADDHAVARDPAPRGGAGAVVPGRRGDHPRPLRDGVLARGSGAPRRPGRRRRHRAARGLRRPLLARRRRAGPAAQRRHGLTLPRRGAGPPQRAPQRAHDHVGRGPGPARMRRDRGRRRRAGARARQRLVREAAAAHARVVRPGRVPLERGGATARSTSPTITASTPSSRASATGRCSAATSASGPTRPC